jgi:hypothetical protein
VKLKLDEALLLGLLGAAVTVVSGAAVSTVQVKVAGLASVLPAGSVARTLKVCEPSARPVYGCGLVQAEKPPPSSWQAKVEPGSLEVKSNAALAEAVSAGGFEVIVVFGATASTVHVWTAGVASTLPAGSIARTRNVWEPLVRPLYGFGLVHAEYPPVSSSHWNVEPAWLEVKLKLTEPVLGLAGAAVIVVSGSVLSTVTVCFVESSVFPAASVARARTW